MINTNITTSTDSIDKITEPCPTVDSIDTVDNNKDDKTIGIDDSDNDSRRQSIIRRITFLWIPLLSFMFGLVFGVLMTRYKYTIFHLTSQLTTQNGQHQPPQPFEQHQQQKQQRPFLSDDLHDDERKLVKEDISDDPEERKLVKDDIDYDYFTSYMTDASVSRKKYINLIRRIQNEQYQNIMLQQQRKNGLTTDMTPDRVYVRFYIKPSSQLTNENAETTKHFDIEITSSVIQDMPHTVYTFLQLIQSNIYQQTTIRPISSSSLSPSLQSSKHQSSTNSEVFRNLVVLGLLPPSSRSSQSTLSRIKDDTMMNNENDIVKRYKGLGYMINTSPLWFHDEEIMKESSASSKLPYSIGFLYRHDDPDISQSLLLYGPEIFMTLPPTISTTSSSKKIDDDSAKKLPALICFGRMIMDDDSSNVFGSDWLESIGTGTLTSSSPSSMITDTRILPNKGPSTIRTTNRDQ